MNSVRYFILCLFALGIVQDSLMAQIAINRDGSSAHSSAALELKSSNQGFLMPRMTYAQRTSLPTTEGLMVYQTDNASGTTAGFYLCQGGAWAPLKQDHYNVELIMQFNFAVSGNIANGDITAEGVGISEFDMTGYTGYDENSTIIVSSEFLPNPSAPRPPQDYCAAEHTGNCTSRYENTTVVISEGGEFVTRFPAFGGAGPLDLYLFHGQSAGACENSTTNTDYYFIDDDGSATGGPLGGDPYDDSDGGFLFFPYAGLGGMAAGDDFDIHVSGNDQNNVAQQTNVSVFIDWNSDGDFFDSVDGISEVVVATPVKTWHAPYSFFGYGDNVFTRTIPTNAVSGSLGMRVMASRFPNNSAACISDTEGSTKDYIFKVTGGITPSRPGEPRTCNVYNQTSTDFQVRCFDQNGNPENTRFYLQINPE